MKNEQNNYINSVNLNADSDFPYLVLDVVGDQSYPRNPGFQVMHWHEDLQFIYVLDGEIEIKENKDGKLVWKCPNCGNTDEDKMNVARRTCGYIGTQFWNQGRTQEIKERVLHL